MNTFHPRRSARLAAKGTGAPVVQPMMVVKAVPIPMTPIRPMTPINTASIPPIPMSDRTKEEARDIFLANKDKPVSYEMKKECLAIVNRYLNDISAVRGKTSKAVLASRLMHYFLQIPQFLAAHARFHETVLKKMEEFKQERDIPDVVVNETFHKTIEDVLFAYGPARA
jgi:hypothetical protein